LRKQTIYLYFFLLFYQTRNLLGVFEKDAWMLKGFAQHYHRCCDRVHRAQVSISNFKDYSVLGRKIKQKY
jgi:hypothetical protein